MQGVKRRSDDNGARRQLPTGAEEAVEELKVFLAEIEAAMSQAERLDGLNEDKQK